MPNPKKPRRPLRRKSRNPKTPASDQARFGFEQVERILRDTVATAAEVFGEDHPHYARALEHLASYLHRVGREEEASAALAKRSAVRIDRLRHSRASWLAHSGRPSPAPERAVLALQEAARYLAISPDTLYKLVRSGEISHTRVGKSIRFRPMDLDRFLEERTTREWLRLDARGRPRRLT